jgi:MFS family permease
LTTFEAAGILGTFLFSSISDRIGRRRILFALSMLAPLALFVFASLHGWAQLPFLAIVGAACLSVHPVSLALVQETFPETRALATSLYISMNFLIAAGAAVIIGAMGDAIGLRPAFKVAAGFMLLGLPLLLLLPADHQRA